MISSGGEKECTVQYGHQLFTQRCNEACTVCSVFLQSLCSGHGTPTLGCVGKRSNSNRSKGIHMQLTCIKCLQNLICYETYPYKTFNPKDTQSNNFYIQKIFPCAYIFFYIRKLFYIAEFDKLSHYQLSYPIKYKFVKVQNSKNMFKSKSLI